MIELSSHDGAQYRIERLQKTVRIAREILCISEAQSSLLIRSLCDNRGTLQVVWSAEPTQHQHDAFATAWSLVGENSRAVEHSHVPVPG